MPTLVAARVEALKVPSKRAAARKDLLSSFASGTSRRTNSAGRRVRTVSGGTTDVYRSIIARPLNDRGGLVVRDSQLRKLRALTNSDAAKVVQTVFAAAVDRRGSDYAARSVLRVAGSVDPAAIPIARIARKWLAKPGGLPLDTVARILSHADATRLIKAMEPLVATGAQRTDAARLLTATLELVDGSAVRRAVDGPVPGDDEHSRMGGGGGGDPEPPPGGGGDPEPSDERVVWPELHCPDLVAAGGYFDLTVGISDRKDPTLKRSTEIRLPTGGLTLDVVVMYDPFAFEPVGWSNPVRLQVTRKEQCPRRTLSMIAVAGADLERVRRISVEYFVFDTLRGRAAREVEVGEQLTVIPLYDESQLDIGPLLEHAAPDLFLIVEHGATARFPALLWTARSSIDGVNLPSGPFRKEIGNRPDVFAGELRSKVSAANGDDARATVKLLHGVGKDIADKIPEQIQDALRKVALARPDRSPTVLLLSAEPHVPWELAVLDEKESRAAGQSPFLGATMTIGRWVLHPKRPKPRPPTEAAATTHAVVTANYSEVPGWPRLESAEKEAASLRRSYKPALNVPPYVDEVFDCLEGGPAADVLHFALHGTFNQALGHVGVVLLRRPAEPGGTIQPFYLRPEHIEGMTFAKRPFVFLNACQTGASDLVLGDYSGMAAAFLKAGAAGVIAPLWNVDDKTAGDIAKRFYKSAYGKDNVAPAEIVRLERATVTQETRTGKPGTVLAYQFFGHPNLRLSRKRTGGRGSERTGDHG